MAFKYTEEQLNKLDKELVIQLFLGLQDQMEELTIQTQALNDKMQLMMEQIVLSNKDDRSWSDPIYGSRWSDRFL